MDAEPFFSVVITTYDRSKIVERCVRSCLDQTYGNFEVVVVDDGSTDDTISVLEALNEPRLRIVRHERNRGISPARATGVEHARGQWFVIVDSDWVLFPHTLARLRELIDTLPPDVRWIRSRLQWDNGRVGPSVLPDTPITDYNGRLRWLEAIWEQAAHGGADADAAHCMHRSIFETTKFIDRRGSVESLWELDLARDERSLWVEDILGQQHADAENSYTREVAASRLVPRLIRDAGDMLWMDQAIIERHGSELAAVAPYYWRATLESVILHAFLVGDRRSGLRHARTRIRAGSVAPKTLVTVMLGLIDRRVLAYTKAAGRQWRARLRQ